MNVDGGLLLAGPRGRRFCLELAMELGAELRDLVFRFVLRTDVDAGRAALLVLTEDEEGPVPPSSAVSTKDITDALAVIDLGQVDADVTLKALQTAVFTAMYWQEPDGGDHLARFPEVRAALLPLAEQILAHPSVQWFWRTRQPEQWAIDWRPADDPAPLPKEPEVTLGKWARNERAEELRAATERPRDPHANYSGSWWSIPLGLIRTVGRIPEGLSLVEDYPGFDEATVIPVRGVGTVLEINGPEDWVRLCRKHPLDVTASRRHDWFRVTGRDGRWVIPDWEQVAREWDAIHLTVLGYLSSATQAFPVDTERSTVLGGWDPDSTIWLTDVAREWIEPPQTWHRSMQNGRWQQSS